MMKKILLSLFAVVAVVATYAGMKTFSASSDMENDNTIVYVKSNANGNSAITLGVPEEGIGKDGGKGISVVSVAGAAEDWDAQMWLMLPETAPAGTKVSVKFDYKASAAVTVGTQCHGEPGAYMHWGCIGDVNFTTEWQTYNGTLTVPGEADGMKSIAFNLAKDRENDVTFYIDNVELSFEKEVREEGEPEPIYAWVDITADEHTVKSSRGDAAGQSIGVADNEEGIVTLTTQGAQEWDAQFWINFTEALKSNTQVRVSFDCKADHAESIGTQSHDNPGGYLHWAAIGDVNFGTEWNTFTWSGKVAAEANGMKSIAFNMAKSENAFYVKNISVQALLQIQQEELVEVITPSFVNGEDEVTLNSHSNVSVGKAEGLKVNLENMPSAIGVTYLINEMNMNSDDEGIFWTVGAEVAAGEANANGIAYSEFENAIKFEQGKKYQLTVSVIGGNPADPTEIGNAVYEFNGSCITSVADGDYVIMNVATGQYLNGANAWGTRASITKHGQFMTIAKLEDGKYTIDSHISNGGASHFLGENVYVDAAAFGFTLENIEGNVWAIKNGDKFLASNTSNTEVNFDADEATEAAQWMILSKEDILDAAAEATADEPVDMTALVGDANFSRNNQYKSQWTIEASNKNLAGGANENMCAESFHSAFTLSQTIENIPNGQYKVCVQGFYRQDGTDEALPYFYANEATVNFINVESQGTPAADDNHTVQRGDVFIPNSMGHASNLFGMGQFVHEIDVVVSDNTLTIGAKNDNTALWVIWDNFEVYFLGEPEPEPAILPAFVNGEEEIALNSHSSVSVDMAQALKVNIENMPAVIGASYTIYGMKAVSDEEGTYWNVDYSQELAAGEMSVKSFGYVEFDETIYFEQGQKYQVAVTAYYGNPAEPGEMVEYFIVDGAYVPEMAVIPTFINGEEEIALNSHSQVNLGAATALKVDIENAPQVIGVTYLLNEMVMGSDDEGTFWNVGAELAAGEMSMNTVAYTEFASKMYFEYGKKYQLTLTVFENPQDPTEIGTYTYQFNGSSEIEIADLTSDMFKQYYSNTTGEKLDEPAAIGIDYNVGVSNGMIYGLSTVKWFAYADVTDYDQLILNVTEGTPRVMYNREMNPENPDADGVNHVEITSASDFLTIEECEDGSKNYIYDLKAMAAANPEKPYVHINAIKGANWANATITEMKLIRMSEGEVVVPNVVEVALIAGDEEYLLNDHSIVTVDLPVNGIKVTGLEQSQDELTFAIYGPAKETLVEGTLSVNTIGYAEFPEVSLYQGIKYNVVICANGEVIYDNTVIGAAEPTIAVQFWNGAALMEDGAELDLAETKSINVTVELPAGVEPEDDLLIQGVVYGKDGTEMPVTGYTDFEDGVDVDLSRLTPGNAYVLVINKVAFGDVVGMDEETFMPIYANTYEDENGIAILNFSLKAGAVESLLGEPEIAIVDNVLTLTYATPAGAEGGSLLAEGIKLTVDGVEYFGNADEAADQNGKFVVTLPLSSTMNMTDYSPYIAKEGDVVTITVMGPEVYDAVNFFNAMWKGSDLEYTYTVGASKPAAIDMAALVGQVFYLKNAATGEYLYGKDAQNTAMGDLAAANAGVVPSFKLEATEGGYVLRCVTPAGADYALWGSNPCYLNGQPNVGGVTFNLGKDQDCANGSTWNFFAAEDGAYIIQNVGNGGYLAGTTVSAEANTTWILCSADEVGINGIQMAAKDGKFMQNGKVVIVKNGKTYNMNGMIIK